MAYASVTYTSASGTTFALTNSSGDPIQYIRQSDIAVYVNNTLQTLTTDYTFNSAGTAIVLNVAVSGATVLIQRTTDIGSPTVVYTAGSTLTAQDLNNADNQLRYGLQEFRDYVNTAGAIPDGDKGDITVISNGTIWTIDNGAVNSAKIANDTIVNADINSAAAIAHSKLATIAAGQVLLGNSSNVPTATALTGDVTIDSSGVTAIGSGVVVNADVNASAAIAGTKISPDFGSQNISTTGDVSAVNVTLANQGDIRFGEATANGTNYVAFQAPSTIASNVTWTLPATDASVSGYALKSDGAGTLSWGLAGGALGGGSDQIFYENDQTVTTNYTISTNKNAMTAGPVTINSGVTVVVPSGSTWSIV